MTFPLRHRPPASYKERPRSFGSPRRNSRKHAGCDLYASAGDDVLAIADGEVLRGPYLFYDGVKALEVRHGFGIIRYGEISGCPDGIVAGAKVAEGQVVGWVGKMKSIEQSMLHLEMYDGSGSGPLTKRDAPPYSRRGDLVDPTEMLDQCKTVEEIAGQGQGKEQGKEQELELESGLRQGLGQESAPSPEAPLSAEDTTVVT